VDAGYLSALQEGLTNLFSSPGILGHADRDDRLVSARDRDGEPVRGSDHMGNQATLYRKKPMQRWFLVGGVSKELPMKFNRYWRREICFGLRDCRPPRFCF